MANRGYIVIAFSGGVPPGARDQLHREGVVLFSTEACERHEVH
jgi:hypothetical protein